MMNTQNSIVRKCWKGLIALGIAGTMFSGACNTTTIQAILDGVQVATQEINGSNKQNMSFTDWLSSQFH
ncbi:MAG: hypothetical protein HY287_08045 [Planctomycetes bacterium]|nr:hypothetical protein [Planctomycetota bacterium]